MYYSIFVQFSAVGDLSFDSTYHDHFKILKLRKGCTKMHANNQLLNMIGTYQSVTLGMYQSEKPFRNMVFGGLH